MSTEVVKHESKPVTLAPPSQVELGTLQANDAKALVHTATGIANELAQVIDDRKLFNKINGRKYVRCEGWTTLAVMLGVIPREVSNVEHEDGSFEAVVELIRLKDGVSIGRASALCGMDEATWKNRPKYARRSMAATRATGKACRLAFSWIMALAGYEATPEEEMDRSEHSVRSAPALQQESRKQQQEHQGGVITEKQRRRLYAIWKKAGWPDDSVQKFIESHWDYQSTKDIQRHHYDLICRCIEDDRAPTKEELEETQAVGA